MNSNILKTLLKILVLHFSLFLSTCILSHKFYTPNPFTKSNYYLLILLINIILLVILAKLMFISRISILIYIIVLLTLLIPLVIDSTFLLDIYTGNTFTLDPPGYHLLFIFYLLTLPINIAFETLYFNLKIHSYNILLVPIIGLIILIRYIIIPKYHKNKKNILN